MGDLEARRAVAAKLFRKYDTEGRGELSAVQMQRLHETIRIAGISLAQVRASMAYCCLMDDCCEPSELFDLLQEMDRRYFLVQDLRWEFALLDREHKDLIPEDQARFLFEVVHGQLFSLRGWEKFRSSRPVPGTDVSFPEIEVELCNIPSREVLALEQLEHQQKLEDRQRRSEERRVAEEQRRRELEEEEEQRRETEEEEQRQQDEQIWKQKQEDARKIEEDARRRAEEERLEKEREHQQIDELEHSKQEVSEREAKERAEQEAKERAEQEHSEEEAEHKRQVEIIEEQQALEAQRALEGKAAALKEEEQREAEKNKNAEEEAAAPDDKDGVHHLELEMVEEAQRLEQEQREIEGRALALAKEEQLAAEKSANVELEAEKAAELEKLAQEEARKAEEALKQAKNAAERKAAEEAQKVAKEKAKREKNERIRKDLKVAIKRKDRDMITKAVKEFRSAKLVDTEGDLKKAEMVLKRLKAKENLIKAMEERTLESLETAINEVKKNGFEAYMPHEMATANKMLLRLKRLKRLKDEILNLKQSTVAEIRSYSKPLPQVQKVMTSTYLLLGNKESELKDWKKMQGLIGKTGKEALKRRVMEMDPNKIPVQTAERVRTILAEFDLEQVRDVSAGAAVFFAWCSATQEDVLERERQKEEGAAPSELKVRRKIKNDTSTGTLTVTV